MNRWIFTVSVGILGLCIWRMALEKEAEATHLQILNAENITTGILPNARLDNSSVTKLGPDIPMTSIVGFTGNYVFASSQIASAPQHRFHAVSISSLSAIPGSANISSSNVDGLNAALQRLHSIGLTSQTSGYGSILLGSGGGGLFNYSGGTIPAGVTVYCAEGSSTVLRPIDTNTMMLTVYGELNGCAVDLQNRAWDGNLIDVKSGGRLKNVKIYGGQSMRNDSSNAVNLIRVIDSTRTYVSGSIDGFKGSQQDFQSGAVIALIRSSHCYVDLNVKNGIFDTADVQGIYLQGTGNVTIDGTFDDMGGRGVMLDGGNRDYKIKGKYFIKQGYSAGGFIYIVGANGGHNSTGTISAEFYHNVVDADEIIGIANTTFRNEGVNVTGSYAVGMIAGTNPPLAVIGSNVIKTIISETRVFNIAAPSDSGVQSDFSGTNLFVDGVEQ